MYVTVMVHVCYSNGDMHVTVMVHVCYSNGACMLQYWWHESYSNGACMLQWWWHACCVLVIRTCYSNSGGDMHAAYVPYLSK